MDAEKFKAAQEEYKKGDYRLAARGFLESTEPGTPISNGAAYHMAGNSFMRLKRYEDAITVYEHALKDDTYLRRASVEGNLANAYLKAGEYDTAISHYQAALEEPDIRCPYKCYQGMGAALMEQGLFEQAAIAYRRSALDESNPEPGRSLVNLGLCLMSLHRPADAIEAYKAALGTDSYKNTGRALSNLGIAYFETQKWSQAIRAFEEAATLHGYKLSPSASALLEQARREFEAAGSIEPAEESENSVDSVNSINLDDTSFDDDFTEEVVSEVVAPAELSATVAADDIAILAADLAGQSTDAFIPVERDFEDSSVEDTIHQPVSRVDEDEFYLEGQNLEGGHAAHEAQQGVEFGNENDVENFFGRSEKEAAKLGKQKAKENRSRFGFVKWIIGVVLALAIIGGAAAGIYFTGFGVPTPKEVVSNAITAYNTGKAFESYWADTTNTVREMAAVPVPSKFTVDSVDVNGFKAVVNVKVKPESGTALAFRFNVVRSGIGWKISSVENEY